MNFSVEEVIRALEQDEFYLEYMPIVSLRNGTCVAAEALVRWRKGETVISPLEFIPCFEESPKIGLLTYWMIEKIATELGPWMKAHSHFHLGMNVPPELLGRGALAYVGNMAGLQALYPQLVIEVTERGVPDKTSLEGLRFAHRLGMGVAIDDVESTHLNLLLLARSKVDYLKLDKSLIDPVGSSGFPKDLLAELEPILALGQPLVVAEGIETEVQFQYLKQLGVPLGQGWYISKSLGRDDLLRFHDRCAGPGACF